MGDNGRPPGKITRRNSEPFAPWIFPSHWLKGGWGHGESAFSFPIVLFRLFLSGIFIFCYLAKANSFVIINFFLPLLVFCLFWFLIENIWLLVLVLRKHKRHFKRKPTSFSENLMPSPKSNVTVIFSRRWYCFQIGFSFPTTKPIELKVLSSSLKKREMALALFSNTKFC